MSLKGKKIIVNAIVETDPRGGYSAFVPSMPGVITEGRDMEELQFNLKDAMSAWTKPQRSMVKGKIKSSPVYVLPIEVYA